MEEENNLQKRNINWKLPCVILLSILGVALIGFLSLYLYIAISSKKDDYKYYLITNSSMGKSVYVKYNELPNNLINAILASNDNPNYLKEKTSFTSSIFNNNYFNTSIMSISNKVNENFKEDTNFIRRVRKAYIAKVLESKHSKETILEYYVNNAYLGNNLYGFENASQEYFNKSLKDLNLDEITLLVAISINPNSYNLNDNVESTHTMQKVILKKMIKYGYITDNEYNSLKEDKDYEEIKIFEDDLKNDWIVSSFDTTDDFVIYNNVQKNTSFKFRDESTLVIENNVGYFVTTNNEKIKINIPNIEKIYVQVLGCTGSDYIYIFTKNGDIYFRQVSDVKNEYEDSYEKIELKEKIVDLKILMTDRMSTCDYPFYILGISEDSKEYLISINREYDFKYITSVYTDGKYKTAYVKANRDIEIDGKIIEHKFKMGLFYDYLIFGFPNVDNYPYIYDAEGNYLIVEGDYLYSIKDEKLVSSKKIKKIYRKNGKDFKIFFEDNSTFEFSN